MTPLVVAFKCIGCTPTLVFFSRVSRKCEISTVMFSIINITYITSVLFKKKNKNHFAAIFFLWVLGNVKLTFVCFPFFDSWFFIIQNITYLVWFLIILIIVLFIYLGETYIKCLMRSILFSFCILKKPSRKSKNRPR